MEDHSRAPAGRLVLRQKSLTSYLKISVSGKITQSKGRHLLGRRVLDKLNPFLDVALEASDRGLDELFLVGVGAAEDVDGLLCSTGLWEVSVRVVPWIR